MPRWTSPDRRPAVVDEAERRLGPRTVESSTSSASSRSMPGPVRVVGRRPVLVREMCPPRPIERSARSRVSVPARPAGVVEDLGPALQHDVRDQLLEPGVGLDLAARAGTTGRRDRGRVAERSAVRPEAVKLRRPPRTGRPGRRALLRRLSRRPSLHLTSPKSTRNAIAKAAMPRTIQRASRSVSALVRRARRRSTVRWSPCSTAVCSSRSYRLSG